MRADIAAGGAAEPLFSSDGKDRAQAWDEAMRSGDFGRAWAITDAFLREPLPAKHEGPRHFQRIWRGEPLAGRRVLVRCYHGLGDTIQFVRFAAPLRALAREVTVWCQPELMNLVGTAAGVDRVVPLHEGTPDVAFDVDIEIMELAHALRVTARDVGARVPYLACRPEPRPRDGRFRIGLVAEAGDWDRRRSVPLSALEPLLRLPDAEILSLRPGTRLDGLPIRDFSTPSIDTLAARLCTLDAVVSVDTMVAHLAGALGLTAATLLHSCADWRWGRGETSVWYPTMRLFRQQVPGEWSAPVAALAGWLSAKVAPCVRNRT